MVNEQCLHKKSGGKKNKCKWAKYMGWMVYDILNRQYLERANVDVGAHVCNSTNYICHDARFTANVIY